MKRLSSLAMAAVAILMVAVFVLAGCNNPTPTPTPTPKPTATVSPSPTPTTKPSATPSPTPTPFTFPARMTIVSSTSQQQWVSIQAVMQQSMGNNISVVPQGTTNLRYEAIAAGEGLMTAAGPSDFQSFMEATGTNASKTGGPFQARSIWPYNISNSAYMVTKASGIKLPSDIKAGMTIADFAGSGALPTLQLPAILAWANLKPADVKFRSFSNYAASLQAVKDGQADIAFVVGTASATVLPFGDDCVPIVLDATKDAAGAARFLAIWPTAGFMPIIGAQPAAWKGIASCGSLTSIITRAATDTALIYNLTKWFDVNYAKYKDAYLDNVAMTFDNLVAVAATSPAPLHDGTIQYMKEKGKWTAANDARQKANLDTFTALVNGYKDAQTKATAAGVAVDPTNKAWLDFWAKYKTDNKLPTIKSYPGL